MLRAGFKLGPYEILAPLGKGGMGEVYRARDERLGRDVAIKVLPPSMTDSEDALKRFEHEARSVAALSHPNILNVFDIGAHAGVAYVVLELLEGETLRKRLKGETVPWPKAVEIASGIAEGLAAAHARGIIHRDLKPENLFITTDGVVKILDFGLARSESAAPETPLPGGSPTMTAGTRPGAVMGTIGYMSPEQLRGQPIDTRTDIFSFGCVLYEMLTAGQAFVRDTTADTMTAILKEAPPDASTVNKGIPLELSRVLRRCLEKKADERFHSARDLSFALRTILSGSGSPGKTGSEMPAERLQRNVLTGATAIAIIVALLFLMFRELGPNEPASPHAQAAMTRLAILPFEDNSPEPQGWLACGLADEISRQLGRVNPAKLGVVGPETTAYYAEAGNAVRALREDLGVQFALSGSIQVIGEAVRITASLIRTDELTIAWSDEFKGTMDDPFDLQSMVADRIMAGLPLGLTAEEQARFKNRYVPQTAAEVACMRGRFFTSVGSVEKLLRAVSFFEQAIEIDPKYALAYCGLVDAKCVLASWGTLQTSQIRSEMDDTVARALALDDTLAEAHVSAGLVATFLNWDWAAAEAAFKRAIDLNPNISNAHHEYGFLLTLVGRYDVAEEQFKEAIRLSPVSSWHRANLGMLYAGLGRLSEAERLMHSALELDEDCLDALFWLADVRQKQGRFDDAVKIMERAVFSVDDHALAMRCFLANAYAMAGQTDDARKQLAEMHKWKDEVPGHHMWFGEFHAALGETDEAFRRLDQALEAREAWLPHIRFDPGLIHIRSDPRFAELHRKMGLGHVDLSVPTRGP